MGDEVIKLVEAQGANAAAAVLYTIGLQGHRSVCQRWAPLPHRVELCEEMEERALRQANTLGGVHNFLFELYDADKASLGSEVFRVGAEHFEPGGKSLLSEPANEGGLVAQMMRHTEAGNMALVKMSAQTHSALLKQTEVLSRRAERAEERGVEMLTVLHDVLSGKAETEAAVKKAEGNATATVAIANRIAGLLPAITAGFVGKMAGANGAGHFAATGAENLFSTITPEQYGAIMGIFTDEQKAQLYTVMAGLAKERETRATAEKAAADKAGADKAKGASDARH